MRKKASADLLSKKKIKEKKPTVKIGCPFIGSVDLYLCAKKLSHEERIDKALKTIKGWLLWMCLTDASGRSFVGYDYPRPHG